MINTIKQNFQRALYALIFSFIAIGTLAFLNHKTAYGLFLAVSFGATCVLVFGYPESPFAQPKNVFFGHFITSLIGVLVLQFIPAEQFIITTIAVSLGIFAMILLGVTHPPAGGNPIVIIGAGYSYKFLLNPIIFGTIIIIIFGIIFNRFILKKNYPLGWEK